LAHRAQRAQEEMLMFYSVVTRTRSRLTLSYPAVSADGEPLSCSPYLTALQELFDPEALKVHLEEHLDPIPEPSRVLSFADARVRGMAEALERQPGLLRSIGEHPETGASVRNLVAAAQMHVARFSTPGFTNYEGMLENPDNLEWIAARYSQEHEFSATQLEAYATCPFQYFASQVLAAEPLPVVELEIEYGRRGTLVHEVLAELHRELSGESGGPGGDSSTISARFHALLEAKLGERPKGSAVEQALLEIEERLLRDWGSAYGEQHQGYVSTLPEGCERPPVPSLFETAFGKSGRESAAPAREALVIGTGERAVRVGGRIDRIDVGASSGKTVFTVIDYKTGKSRSDRLDDIAAGKALQLALYTLAIVRLGLAGPEAMPLLMGYWHIREQGFATGMRTRRKPGAPHAPLDQAVWESLEKTLDEIVPRLAGAMRSGQFPIYNTDQHCTGRCPYHAACRVSQIRALPEQLAKIWSP
jgi:ATP-dependent helicase/nuclease subunit B